MSQQQYDNTNRGVLFINDRKEKDTHPDRKGTLNVEGVEYFIDGWIKKGNKGQFLSLSVKRKNKQAGAQAPQSESRPQKPAPARHSPPPPPPQEQAPLDAGCAPEDF